MSGLVVGDLVVLVKWNEPRSPAYFLGLRPNDIGEVICLGHITSCSLHHGSSNGPFIGVLFKSLAPQTACVPTCYLRRIDPDRLEAATENFKWQLLTKPKELV